MATITDEVVIKIKLAHEKAKASLEIIKKEFKNMGDSIVKNAKRAAVALAGLVTALGAMIVSTAKTGDEVAKMSKRLNISTEDLSALRFQAGLAGTDFQTAANGIRFMTKAMFDSTQGLETAQRGFELLGISVTKTDGKLKDAQDVFLEISDALADMEDGTEKTAAAQLIFGSRMGTRLIPLLNQGSDALREQAEEARKLGIIFDEEAARKSEVLVDSMLRFRKSIEGVKNEIAFELIPKVSKYLLVLKDWILANKQLIAQNIQITIQLIAEALISLRDGAIAIAEFVKENNELIKTLSSMAVGFSAVALAISIATGNIPGAIASLALLKGAIAGLGIALAVDKIQEFSKEIKTIKQNVNDTLIPMHTMSTNLGLVSTHSSSSAKAMEKIKGLIKAFPELFQSAGEAGKEAAGEIKSAWDKTSDTVKEAFKALGIIPKKQFDEQAQALIDQFKIITQQEELTDQQVIELREQLFRKLGELADQAEASDVLGFKPEDIQAELDALHQQLLDSVVTFRPEISKAGDATIVEFKKIQQTQSEIARDTIESLRDVFDNSFLFQVEKFASLQDLIDGYQDFYVNTEEAITEVVKEETEERLGFVRHYVQTANGLLAQVPIPSAVPVGTATELPAFANGINRVPHDMIAQIHKNEQVVPASQNPFNPNSTNDNRQDNRQFTINLNGGNRIGIEQEFALEQTLKNLSRFDASLAQ